MSLAAALSGQAIPGGGEYWHLHLYVAGQSPNSVRALANLRELCEEHMSGHYQIEVRDLAEDPYLARSEEILATPTLVRRLPEPACRIIGDFSDNKRVLAQLRPEPTRPATRIISIARPDARCYAKTPIRCALAAHARAMCPATSAEGSSLSSEKEIYDDIQRLSCGSWSSDRRVRAS